MNDPTQYADLGDDFMLDEQEVQRQLSNEQVEEIQDREESVQEQMMAEEVNPTQPVTAGQPAPMQPEPQPTGGDTQEEEKGFFDGFGQNLSYFGQPLGETNEQVKQRLSAPGQGFFDFVTEAINSRLPDNFQIPKATKYEDSVAQATRNISSVVIPTVLLQKAGMAAGTAAQAKVGSKLGEAAFMKFIGARGIEAGASVAVAARDEDRNAEAVSILEPLGEGKTMGVACDVLDESLVNKAVQEVHEEMGSIDILINSAGINFRGAIDEVPVEEFRKVMEVNVTGTWLGCKAVVPIMKKQEYGRIVNLASIFSVVGFADRTPYNSSKGAVLNMTRALAIELAPWKITVNAMLPGPFATEMNLPLLDDPEKFKTFVSNIPMDRWGELTEIGGLSLFLSSQASSFCTGGAYSIDGGWTAR